MSDARYRECGAVCGKSAGGEQARTGGSRLPRLSRRPAGAGRVSGGSRAAGMTLLEVAVALAVIIGTAVGVFSAIVSAHAMEERATDELEARNLACRVVEELRVVPIDDLVPYYHNTQVDSGELRAFITVEQVEPATGTPSLLRLEVRVRTRGGARDISKVVTLRAERRAPNSAWLMSL